MISVFGYIRPRDVKSPVRASDLGGNWIGMSFFMQTTYLKQFRKLLAANRKAHTLF